MSVHIEAKKGQIADKILLPGDPLRAKFIAENFLEDAQQFNNVRGMLGYTGTYKGHRISVMGRACNLSAGRNPSPGLLHLCRCACHGFLRFCRP